MWRRQSTFILWSYFYLLLSRRLFHEVHGFPSQAGACPGGQAAVSGSHSNEGTSSSSSSKTIRVIGNDDWSENFRFQVNDVDVTSSSSPVALVREGSYIFRVDAINSTTMDNTDNDINNNSSLGYFRGILIRIQQETNSSTTTSSSFSWTALERNAQSALACVGTGVMGITHTDNLPKYSISGLFQTLEETNVTVDVTIVVANTDTESIYGYKQYIFQVVPPDNEIDNDSNATTTLPNQTTAPTISPSATMQPTFTDYCNVCGIEDVESSSNVSTPIMAPDNMITLAGKTISCDNLQQIAERQLLPMSLCEEAQSLVRSECGGCNTTFVTTIDATSEPTDLLNMTVAPTPMLPTYCMVCPWGMDLVHPENMVRTSGTTCREFADGSVSIDRSSPTCELYRKTIESDCGGCQATMAPTSVPTPPLRRIDTPTPTSSIASNDKSNKNGTTIPSDNTSVPPNDDPSSSISSTSTGFYRLFTWRKLVKMESFLVAIIAIVEL
jgi:hypothetical protein